MGTHCICLLMYVAYDDDLSFISREETLANDFYQQSVATVACLKVNLMQDLCRHSFIFVFPWTLAAKYCVSAVSLQFFRITLRLITVLLSVPQRT